MSKRSTLNVRAGVWSRIIAIGRGRSYRMFKSLAECRQYAAGKGYDDIRVEFC